VGHGIEWDELIEADVDTPWRESCEAQDYKSFGKNPGPALGRASVIKWLDVAGLATGLSDIRVWVCKGGDVDFTRFALEFTGLIRQRNKSALVTAYKGYRLLLPRSGRKKEQMNKDAIESQPAKEHKLLINKHPTFVLIESLDADIL
jgi:hypothetical protein